MSAVKHSTEKKQQTVSCVCRECSHVKEAHIQILFTFSAAFRNDPLAVHGLGVPTHCRCSEVKKCSTSPKTRSKDASVASASSIRLNRTGSSTRLFEECRSLCYSLMGNPHPASMPPASPGWMESIESYLGKKPLKKVVFPGTHDSASYAVTPDKPVNPYESGIFAIVRRLQAVGGLHAALARLLCRVIADWGKSQQLNCFQQLYFGVRYLDLRVCLEPESRTVFTLHGLYSEPVLAVLEAVRTFIELHPREIVLLDFNQFLGMDGEAHQDLQRMISEQLGPRLVPRAYTPLAQVEELWAHKVSVIVLYGGDLLADSIVEYNAFLWWGHTSRLNAGPESNIVSSWPRAETLRDLFLFLDAELGRNVALPDYANKFFVLQAVITPGTSTIMEGLDPLVDAPRNLLELGHRVSPQVTEWIRTIWARRQPNIVIVDSFETSNLLDLAVELNTRRK